MEPRCAMPMCHSREALKWKKIMNSVNCINKRDFCKIWFGENWTSSATRPASSSQRLAFIRRKACHRSSIDDGGSLCTGNGNGTSTPRAHNFIRKCANSSSSRAFLDDGRHGPTPCPSDLIARTHSPDHSTIQHPLQRTQRDAQPQQDGNLPHGLP